MRLKRVIKVNFGRDLMIVAVTGILVSLMGTLGFAWSIIFLLSIELLDYSSNLKKFKEEQNVKENNSQKRKAE